MKKFRIFLTGGSGFIGRNIFEQLGEKYTILIPSHQELELTDAEAVREYLGSHPVDVVVHTANVGGNFAEKGFPNPAAYNLRIFLILLEMPHILRNLFMWDPVHNTANSCRLSASKKQI